MDVGTGFGLWAVALVLLLAGQVFDTVLSNDRPHGWIVLAVTGVFLVCLSAVVLTFLLLMRHGYRWARTLLTSGGIVSVMYVTTSLFTVQRGAVSAVVFAVTGILGSVLILGGVYLLYRKDAHAFFVR